MSITTIVVRLTKPQFSEFIARCAQSSQKALDLLVRFTTCAEVVDKFFICRVTVSWERANPADPAWKEIRNVIHSLGEGASIAAVTQ